MPSIPTTVSGLFAFYHDRVKPIYSASQLRSKFSVEVIFELNAAFDHLSRQYTYNESEEQAVAKAYAHLKRCCLDIFKLAVKDAIDRFDELRRTDTSIIDNGEFDRELLALYSKILQGAEVARAGEGDAHEDDGQAIKAFDLWEPVYADCVKLAKFFYFSPKVTWAKKKQRQAVWLERGVGFLLGILASVIASVIWHYATR